MVNHDEGQSTQRFRQCAGDQWSGPPLAPSCSEIIQKYLSSLEWSRWLETTPLRNSIRPIKFFGETPDPTQEGIPGYLSLPRPSPPHWHVLVPRQFFTGPRSTKLLQAHACCIIWIGQRSVVRYRPQQMLLHHMHTGVNWRTRLDEVGWVCNDESV